MRGVKRGYNFYTMKTYKTVALSLTIEFLEGLLDLENGHIASIHYNNLRETLYITLRSDKVQSSWIGGELLFNETPEGAEMRVYYGENL